MSNPKKSSRKDSAIVTPVTVEHTKEIKVVKPEGFKTGKEVEKEIKLEEENVALRVLLDTVLKDLKETKGVVLELKKILSTQNDILQDMIRDGEDEDYSETQISDEEMIENPKKKIK